MKMYRMLLTALLCCFVMSVWANNDATQEVQEEIVEELVVVKGLSYTPNYKIKLFGRISADASAYSGASYFKPGNGTTISQLCMGGMFFFGERMSGKFEIDFSNGHVLLLDNFITYNFDKQWALRVGNIQEAYSMDLLTSFKDLALMNRAQAVNAFAPGHHLGVQTAFENSQWLLTAGIHAQRSMLIKHKEVSDGFYRRGVDEGYSYTARAVWMPQDDEKTKGLHVGAAYSGIKPKTSNRNPDPVSDGVRFASSESVLTKLLFMDTGYITGTDRYSLVGTELAAYHGPLKVQGEYLLNTVCRKDGLKDECFHGYYVQASCLLLGGQQDYNNSRGAFNQPRFKKHDLELALRFDRLDLNGETVKGGLSTQYTAGINYYVNENLKVQFNYAYNKFDKHADANGAILPDLGVASGGGYNNPYGGSGDPVKVQYDGNKYNSFNVRVQLRF